MRIFIENKSGFNIPLTEGDSENPPGEIGHAGSAESDIVHVFSGPAAELAGLAGDDILLDDFGAFLLDIGANTSTLSPYDLDADPALWFDRAGRENPLVGDDRVPNLLLHETSATGRQFFYTLLVPPGETLTADLDAAYGPLGTPGSFDAVLTLLDSSGGALAWNDDASPLLGGAGSSSTRDPFLSWTNNDAESVQVTIRLGQYEAGAPQNSGGFTADGVQFMLFVSLTGHPAAGVLASAQGDSTIDGGDGHDLLVGNGGSDTIIGGAGNNRIFGGSGDDAIVAGSAGGSISDGRNIIDAGDGADVIYAGGGANIVDGGAGHDILSYRHSTAGVAVSLASGVGSGGFAAGDSFSGIESLEGSAFSDWLTGDAGDNLLDCGAGADVLAGGAGDDHYRIDSMADVIIERPGEGFDTLVTLIDYRLDPTRNANVEAFVLGGSATSLLGDDAANRLYANPLLDSRLYGLAGDDWLVGGSGDDILRANVGNDHLVGDTGDDWLSGEDGNDSLEGGSGSDYLLGGADDDVLIGQDGDDRLFGENGSDRLEGGDGEDKLFGGTGNDVLAGGNDADTLRGGPGDDRMQGDAGDDWLFGDIGADTIEGGMGFDHLFGGAGDDVLVGGAGIDILIGEGGADRFVFVEGDFAGLSSNEPDIIRDFDPASGDILDLSLIDAVVGGGDDAFTSIGNTSFSQTAGELRWQQIGHVTMVYMDTDGDDFANHAIRLDGVAMLAETSFFL